MANIEVSLSSLGLPRRRNGYKSGGTRSLHSSHNISASTLTNGNVHHSSSKDIHHYKELEVLKQSVKDKEHLILK